MTFSDDTYKAWDSLLAHIELVGAFEFSKEVFALLGVTWTMLLSVKILFFFSTWSKPKHPHQIQGRI